MTITYRDQLSRDLTPAEVDANFRHVIDSANSTFAQSGSGAVSRTVQAKARDIYSVKDFGVVGDGTTNDSTNFQAAIDAVNAAGGGLLYVPFGEYVCNVTLKEGVVLFGQPMTHVPWQTDGARLIAAAAGAVIDTPVTETRSCGVIGLGIQGLGAGTACKGIRFRDVTRGQVKGVTFNNLSDEGLLVDSTSIACVFEDILAQNCLLDRSQAAKIGAVDFDGTDHHISRVEATTSQSALSDANAYLCGAVIRGDNCFVDSLIGEISDEGIHLTSGASLNRFVNCRADLNFGNGWNVIGTNNRFANCDAINNSQETTNTYDNWLFTGGTNQAVNCMSLSNIVKVSRYGFNDTVSSATTKNRHINPTSSGSGTAEFLNDNANGSAFHFPEHQHVSFSADNATPSVSGQRYFRTANATPTTITNFTGGVSGQQIELLCNDANTTIQHNGSTITLVNAGNKKLRSGVIYKFIRTSSVWRESDYFPLGVTADVGDAAKTLQARLNEETQIWATELTQDRAVTLSATGAYAGAKFHIARPAIGAFNLNVGTGPLKALAAGEWCEVTYSGAAWVLTKFGAL